MNTAQLIIDLGSCAVIIGLLLLLRSYRKASLPTTGGAVRSALVKVVTQGILDWKLPIFLGALIFLAEALGAVIIGLRDYHDWAALPDLEWDKTLMHGIYAGIVALIGFLNKSVARTGDTLKERNGTPSEFQRHVASFETEHAAKPVDTPPATGG